MMYQRQKYPWRLQSGVVRHAVILLASLATCLPGYSAPLAGWTYSSGGSEKNGVQIQGSQNSYSGSPAVLDIDSNLDNGLETILMTTGGSVAAISAAGELLWEADLPNRNCSGSSSSNKTFSVVSAADVNSDGQIEVLAPYGGFSALECGGGVHTLNALTGATVWTLNLKAYAKSRFGTNSNTVLSAAALADADGDGNLEVAFGSHDRNVYFVNSNGKVIWYYNAADTVFSSPAMINVDRNNTFEMIIGTDISENEDLRPTTPDGGFLYAFKTFINSTKKKKKNKKRRRKRRSRRKRSTKKQSLNTRYTFRSSTIKKWRNEKIARDQVIQASPVIADVLPNVAGPEVIIGFGGFFNAGGRRIAIANSKNGKEIKRLSAPGYTSSEVAVADLNNDNQLDIVGYFNGSDVNGQSTVIAWDPRTEQELWRVVPESNGSNDELAGTIHQSAVIADLDGNGSHEVIVANNKALVIINGSDGEVLQTVGLGGRARTVRSTPTIADIDQDGKLDVVIGISRLSDGAVAVAFSGFDSSGDLALNSPDGIHPAYSAPWPMHRGNNRRDGVYRD